MSEPRLTEDTYAILESLSNIRGGIEHLRTEIRRLSDAQPTPSRDDDLVARVKRLEAENERLWDVARAARFLHSTDWIDEGDDAKYNAEIALRDTYAAAVLGQLDSDA